MKFSEHVKLLERDNIIVLVNTCTRNWYKMSKEIFNILNYGIERNFDCNELLAAIHDEEDREIIYKVINNLRKKSIVLDEHDKEPADERNFTVAITDRCNLACKHCSYNAKLYRSTAEKCTYEQLKKRLSKILLLNPTTIAFTGGEPMVRDDFIKLSQWLRTKFDGQLFLMTNGTLITEENVKSITEIFSQIDISIDGVDENTCSQIRGAGVFSKVVKSVELLQKNGFTKISLSMVDTHVTHRFVKEFFSLNKRLKTRPILRSFSEVGRGKINKEQFLLRQQDYSETSNVLSEEFRTNYQKNFKASGCGAGKGVFFVDYDGSVYGCATLRELGYKLGDIEQIETCIDSANNKIYKEMIGNIPDKCRACDVNIFCIECLADFLNVDDKGTDFKKFCCERKRCLEDIIWKKR